MNNEPTFQIGDIVKLSRFKMYEGLEQFRGIVFKITKGEFDHYSVFWLNNALTMHNYGIEELEKVS